MSPKIEYIKIKPCLDIIGQELIEEDRDFRDRRSWKYTSDYHYRDNWKRFDSRSMSGSETGSEDQGRQGRGGGGPAGGKYLFILERMKRDYNILKSRP